MLLSVIAMLSPIVDEPRSIASDTHEPRSSPLSLPIASLRPSPMLLRCQLAQWHPITARSKLRGPSGSVDVAGTLIG